MTCKICQSPTSKIFTKLVLQKYPVGYHQCASCFFIQTDEPFWLQEAYNAAITELDIGLVQRNLLWKPIVFNIIKSNYNSHGKFLDYGGGYGLFVRLMRDMGLDFYRQDMYCDNLFAKHFDLKDLSPTTKFDMLTAFEVFEHLENPIKEIEKMFQYSSSILFSTELQPSAFKLKIQKKTLEDWHYWIPETGQHIALYHPKTLAYIAKKFNKNLYSEGQYLHLLTDKKITPLTFQMLKIRRYSEGVLRMTKSKLRIQNSDSKLPADYELLKSKLNQ